MRITRIICAIAVLCLFGSVNAKGVADSVTETKNVSQFTVLKISGNFNVVLTQSGTCSLKIVAPDKDAMGAITIKNAGVTLNITMSADCKATAILYIGLKDINQVTITTNGTVSNTDKIKTNDLALNIDGNAVVNLTLKTKVCTYTTSSSKASVIKGASDKCKMMDNGEGNVDASGFEVDDLVVEDGSDGDLKVYAHPNLQAKVTASGNFTYYGKPKIKTFKVEGSASSSQITEGSK